MVRFVTPVGTPIPQLEVFLDGKRTRTNAQGEAFWRGIRSNYLYEGPEIAIRDRNWVWSHQREPLSGDLERRFVEQGRMYHRAIVARRREVAFFYYTVSGPTRPNFACYLLELHPVDPSVPKPTPYGNVYLTIRPGRYRVRLGVERRVVAPGERHVIWSWLPETLTFRGGETRSRRFVVP